VKFITPVILFLFACSQTGFAQNAELILPFGHAKQALAAVYNKDGTFVATCAEDNDIIIWNARSGRSERLLRKHVNKPTTLDFSYNGKYLASGGDDRQVIIWNLGNGMIEYAFDRAVSEITLVLFSPDNENLLIGCADGAAYILVLATKVIRVLNKPPVQPGSGGFSFFQETAIRAAEFSGNSKYLFTHTIGGKLDVYSTMSGKLQYSCLTEKIEMFMASRQEMAHFIPGGEKLVVFTASNKMVIDPVRGESLFQLEDQHHYKILVFQIAADGETLSAFHPFGAILKWELNEGKLVSIIPLNYEGSAPSVIYQSAISLRHEVLITAAIDSSFCTWNLKTGKLAGRWKAGSVLRMGINPFHPSFAVAELRKDVLIRKLPDGVILTSLSPRTTCITNAVTDLKPRHILTASNDKMIRIWDLDHARLLQTIPGADKPDARVRLSPQSGFFYTWFSNKIHVYRAADGALVYQLGSKYAYDPVRKTFDFISSADISSDEKYICASSADQTIKIWSLSGGQLLHTLTFLPSEYPFVKALFTPDSRFVAGLTAMGKLGIWETTGGLLLDTLSAMPMSDNLFMSRNRNLFCAQEPSGKVFIYDIDHRKMLSRFTPDEPDDFQSAVFSDNDSLIVTLGQFSCSIRETATGKLIRSVNTKFSLVDAKVNTENNTLLCTTSDGTLYLIDIATGEETGSVKIDENVLPDITDLYDGKILATGNQSIYLLNTENSRTIQLTPVDKSGYIVRTDSDFYLSTREAASLVSWKKENTVFNFAQFDTRYNRPDKVLEALGLKDTGLIASYRKAYYRRIRKLGIDTASFSGLFGLPEANFTNRDRIDYEQTAPTILLHIKATDSTSRLEHFNIWVNDVPIFGLRGIRLGEWQAHYFDTTLRVILSPGENMIETSVLSENGIESLRSPLYVKYTPLTPQQERVYFAGIGIDQFADDQYNLKYSTKDIRDLSKSLQEKYGGNIIIDTLFNEKVNISNIKALKQKLRYTTENDKVIIAYSGHGMLNKDFDYYLSTYYVNFDKPEQNGLPYEELENLLDSIPARKKLLLIDACHSGEVDKEDLVALNASSDSLIKGLKPVGYKQEGQLGLQNSFELMQSLFVNVGKSTGATIISAAAGTQFALERNDLKNGVFTFSILEAMNKHATMKISELKKIVGERVEQLTNGLQKPTSRNETIAVDWNVW